MRHIKLFEKFQGIQNQDILIILNDDKITKSEKKDILMDLLNSENREKIIQHLKSDIQLYRMIKNDEIIDLIEDVLENS